MPRKFFKRRPAVKRARKGRKRMVRTTRIHRPLARVTRYVKYYVDSNVVAGYYNSASRITTMASVSGASADQSVALTFKVSDYLPSAILTSFEAYKFTGVVITLTPQYNVPLAVGSGLTTGILTEAVQQTNPWYSLIDSNPVTIYGINGTSQIKGILNFDACKSHPIKRIVRLRFCPKTPTAVYSVSNLAPTGGSVGPSPGKRSEWVMQTASNGDPEQFGLMMYFPGTGQSTGNQNWTITARFYYLLKNLF